ncbi:MAG: ribosome biogenesis GTPase Der [Xanthomonadaceae bacterium]|nr:ribosome biogenesis GTPase Der [Xanthomonadaceae bacterium]
MLPVIALVGRPNVGKSTLFNFLTRSRDALVADIPGLTRDRQYGFGKVGPRAYLVVDTGGLSGNADGVDGAIAKQTVRAIDEADAVVFLVDARGGRTAADDAIAQQLRRTGKPVWLGVNKAEGLDADIVASEFHALGLGEPHAISAAHGDRIAGLIDEVLTALPPTDATDLAPPADGQRIRVAVAGRPNVGKSTLVNRLLGEDRVLTFDEPGTTRDSIFIDFERDGAAYTLIDTAGMRRRSRIDEVIEKFSVIKTLQAIDSAHVVIAVLDARAGIVEQDATLLGLAVERGRALVIGVNKWDGLAADEREQVKHELSLKLPFLDFARVHFISALHGSGLGELFASVREAWTAANSDLSTPVLTRTLEKALLQHQPPLVGGRRIKLRYAHQGGRNPPVIVIHGNQTDMVPDSYKRFLANQFRETFRLFGTPIRVEFRSGKNPFEGKRNLLTPRQMNKKKRLMKKVKKR